MKIWRDLSLTAVSILGAQASFEAALKLLPLDWKESIMSVKKNIKQNRQHVFVAKHSTLWGSNILTPFLDHIFFQEVWSLLQVLVVEHQQIDPAPRKGKRWISDLLGGACQWANFCNLKRMVEHHSYWRYVLEILLSV